MQWTSSSAQESAQSDDTSPENHSEKRRSPPPPPPGRVPAATATAACAGPTIQQPASEEKEESSSDEDGQSGSQAGCPAPMISGHGLSDSFHFSQLTVEALRNELRSRGLSTFGLKTALVQRLLAATGPGDPALLMVRCMESLCTVLRPRGCRMNVATAAWQWAE
jgi:hypothetical protein